MLSFAAPTLLSQCHLHSSSRCPTRPLFRPTCAQEAPEATSAAESSAVAAATAAFILKKAAIAYVKGGPRPGGSIVTKALRQLEKEQKRNKVRSDVEKLYGQWRLVFTADEKTKNPFLKAVYFPVRAHQTFIRNGDGGIFENGVFWFGGTAFFRVIGPFRWVAPRNRMEFSVDKVTIKIGPWLWSKDGLDKEGATLDGRTAKTLPFFTMFSIRDDFIAARGRTGGLALYARVPDGEYL